MTIINYDSVCPAVLLELFFKASAYNGVTFETKINPSNFIVIDSENAKLAATADSVYVSCWEYYKKKNILDTLCE